MAIDVDTSSFLFGALTAAWIRVTELAAQRTRRRHARREANEGLLLL